MEWWLFLLCATFVHVDADTEISADGRVWHYTPESQTTHWLFPPVSTTDLVVGTGCVLFQRDKNDSIVITFDPFSMSIDALDVTALVRCQLGCDARLEEVAFHGRCQVIKPPGCVRFIPKFRSITLCLKTGEFVSAFPVSDVGDALGVERIHGDVPYNVTIGC